MDLDIDFDEAPLMLALGHVAFSQSPELFDQITNVKSALAAVGLPVAESRQQVTFTLNLNKAAAGTSMKAQEAVSWWFSSPDKRRAVAMTPTSFVLYDAGYSRFRDFLERIKAIGDCVHQICGKGTFLSSVALRYLSGIQVNDEATSFLHPGLRGLPTDRLSTKHFHHNYSFWCDTLNGGRLAVNVKSVHGSELAPKDVQQSGIVLDERFRLTKEQDAILLEIHETVRANVPKEEILSNVVDENFRGGSSNGEPVYHAA